jgi:hypothetical protein
LPAFNHDFLSPARGLDADVNATVSVCLMAHFGVDRDGNRPFRTARPAEASPEPPGVLVPDVGDPPRAPAGKKREGDGKGTGCREKSKTAAAGKRHMGDRLALTGGEPRWIPGDRFFPGFRCLAYGRYHNWTFNL